MWRWLVEASIPSSNELNRFKQNSEPSQVNRSLLKTEGVIELTRTDRPMEALVVVLRIVHSANCGAGWPHVGPLPLCPSSITAHASAGCETLRRRCLPPPSPSRRRRRCDR